LLERYAASTTRKVLLYVRALIAGQSRKNCWLRISTAAFQEHSKSQKSGRSRKCFEKHEIEHILKLSPAMSLCQIFGASPLVLSGICGIFSVDRLPAEEAIALEWSDIKNSQIIVSRAYSQGILKETKTYESRNFP
jgi:hypothetical protein